MIENIAKIIDIVGRIIVKRVEKGPRVEVCFRKSVCTLHEIWFTGLQYLRFYL